MNWPLERLALSILQSTLSDFRTCTRIEHIRFESDRKDIGNKAFQEIENASPKENDVYTIEAFYEQQYESVSNVLDIHQKSITISLCSFLEKALNDLSQDLYRKHDYPIKLTDLKHSGIERAKDYLKEFAKINIGRLTPEWSRLKDLSKIRNYLVHALGEIVLSQEQVIKFEKHEIEKLIERSNYPGLSISGGTYSVFFNNSSDDYYEEIGDIANEVKEINERMERDVLPSDKKRLREIDEKHPNCFCLLRSSLYIDIEQEYIEYAMDEIGRFLDKVYRQSYPDKFQ